MWIKMELKWVVSLSKCFIIFESKQQVKLLRKKKNDPTHARMILG